MPEPELLLAASVAAADVEASTGVLEEARRSTRQHQPRYVDNSLTGDEVFDLLDHFIMEDDDQGTKQRKRRKKKTTAASQQHKRAKKSAASASDEDAPLILRLEKESSSACSPDANPKREPPALRPRWYNQMYVMFLALRQSSGYTSSRSELVRNAVELDRRISEERGLPRAFTGKTPMNSASALLTNNCDRHFTQFRPPGAKCYHFKLAYDPGDFESATRAYNEWLEVLITKDWPLCFGPDPESQLLPELQTQLPAGGAAEESRPGDANSTAADSLALEVPPNGEIPEIRPEVASIPELASRSELLLLPASGEPTDDAPLATAGSKAPVANAIPTSWRDVVEVKPSTIPNAGNGLFAVCDLPGGIPLGFYFGVPMTEDEFDSLKEKVGLASHYSIMYRKTVLDATDKDGMPYTDPDGPMYCPFHFMNEDREGQRYNITFLEGAKVNQIICLTSRAIKRGEELFVSYGDEVDRSHWGNDEEAGMGPNAECDLLSSPQPPRSWMMRGATSACSPIRMANGSAACSDPTKKGHSDLTRLLKSLSTTAPANAPEQTDSCVSQGESKIKHGESV
ncbi:hypothetical protein IWW37_001942 [Coemansia sp. RSA 2050]|nr:hypothetical protein IWW37_001942 [Coemansia sp. RSA 2050]KAJ2735097.1 hypothetical protein IW152_001827 [Coemansia sp. BCRC 34962]